MVALACPFVLMLGLRGCEAVVDSGGPRVVGGLSWAITGIAVLVAARLWISMRREWRVISVEPGHCQDCGYDLQASDERCPECGRSFKLP
jgi:hypothetical protein